VAFDASLFVVADVWAYRARDDSPSEQVQIQAVTPKKNSARIDIIFLDDPDQRVENVPASRLRVPWDQVSGYDESMANWQRVDDLALDDVERRCVYQVYEQLVPEEIAEAEWSPVRDATTVRDRTGLEAIIGRPLDEILDEVAWFASDQTTVTMSPAGTLLVAEAACRANSTRLLDKIIEEEQALRHKCKNGAERRNPLTGEQESTSPEYEYWWYRRSEKPAHELLRQWCGHRAVTAHERLIAAEAENERLDILLQRVVDALASAKDGEFAAKVFAEEHERERITAYTVRPIVDRPLHPSEIPVREVPVRRRWSR
jgi:hypothetical protein